MAFGQQVQHLMLGAVRAIEHRQVLRTTSTGTKFSAFVDAPGKFVQSTPRHGRGT